MKSFIWGDNYLTNILSVDEQHKSLIDIINKLGDNFSQDDVEHGVIESTLDALASYAGYHFAEEQELMSQAGIYQQHIDGHIKSHDSFLSEVLRLSSEASNGGSAAIEHLLDFLIHWLAYHILVTDKNMAKQMKLIKSGVSAEQAFIQEEVDANRSTEPLITALNSLFSQVSQRNKELIALNKTLEDKVARRTKALIEANRDLEQIALTDILTGLPNRRHATQQLSLLWDESTKCSLHLACLMIDADHFKQVNDTHGHDAGDYVLQELSKVLKDSVRTDDLVCRLGGDEFIIILPDTDLEGALLAAKHTHKLVSELRVTTGDSAWEGSVSIGVSARTKEMQNINDLLKESDKGVYLAKENGKNCVKTSQEYPQ
jgi:diguanylate cyclase (GGDEF)-like protein/hemerythrin-like metal-binding protein